MMNRRALRIWLRPVTTRDSDHHMADARIRLPTETSSPSPSSMPRHRSRELLSTPPAQAMCCRWERTRYGSHSLRRTPAAALRCRPQFQLLWPRQRRPSPGQHLPRIIYGAALDDAQLNASAPVPGRFDYSPAPGEVLAPGTHTLSVTFTPADSANYATAQATVSLTVAKATSAIQWPTPDPITYGTQLSATQLCATAPIPGTFEYNPGLGAVLAAGEHQTVGGFHPGRYSGLLYIADCRVTDCGQGNSCHHVAGTGADYPGRRPQRHSAQCHSNSAGIFCLYTCRGRDSRAGSA